jgi:4'-phosphopantetheinyl transferase
LSRVRVDVWVIRVAGSDCRRVRRAAVREVLDSYGGGCRTSVSDSGDVAVVAVTRAPAVGIDIERIRPRRNLDGLARRALPECERRRFAQAPPARRLETFLGCWTAVEARAKARGLGLPALIGRPEEAGAGGAGELAIVPLDVADGFAGSLAVAGSEPFVRVRSWPADAGPPE